MKKIGVIALVGATASGKSRLSLSLARRLDAEIICMDSMQIYRGMDIGTAKPTKEEQLVVPHHLLDIKEPSERFAVSDYVVCAERAIADIAARGHLPMLVGGTGLYLQALMHGFSLGGVKSDEKLRAAYRAIADEPDGQLRLHAMLSEVDPKSAQRLHPNDLRRVIRALEVHELTGMPMSDQERVDPGKPYQILPIGLQMPRGILFDRIENRIGQMMEQGLLHEVQSLLNAGVSPGAQSMQGIGYKELVPAAKGSCTIEEATHRLIVHTRHYAKRQGTLFRKEEAIQWMDALSPTVQDDAYELALASLQQSMNTERA